MDDQEVTAPEISVPLSEHPGRSESIIKLYTAISKFQGEISEPKNNCYNDHLNYWYPDLGACWKAIRQPLANNGLLLIQFTVPHPDEFMIRIVTEIAHTSGEWKSSVLDGRVQELVVLIEDGKTVPGEWNKPVKVPEDSHSNGAKAIVIGYLKRLSLCMVTGLSTDDEVPDNAESIRARKKADKEAQGKGGKKTYSKDSTKSGNGPTRAAQLVGIKKAMELHKLNDESVRKLFNQYGIKTLDQIPDQELSSFSNAIVTTKKLQENLKKVEGEQ